MTIFASLLADVPITAVTVPDTCPCGWHAIGASPWQLVVVMSNCPHHGWVDRTELDIRPVLDWLMSGWIGDPPEDLARDVALCRRPGWLPAAAFARIAERVMDHVTPSWLWPVVREVVATARPALTAWPSPARASDALLPYPTVPAGRVLP